MSSADPSVAIVDYDLGNLFSIRHACLRVGLRPQVSSNPADLWAADAIILPGVGAFGAAMAALRRRDLVIPLRELAQSGKPLLGICLGQQLLFSESTEFGVHAGLDLIPGTVQRFPVSASGRRVKVPHIGWTGIHQASVGWAGTFLAEVASGEYMYFVHSYFAVPADPGVILATSRYCDIDFCSALKYQNISACQFHPERSGPRGIDIYRNFRTLILSPAS